MLNKSPFFKEKENSRGIQNSQLLCKGNCDWFSFIICNYRCLGPSLAYMGRPNETIVVLSLLAGCLIAGFYINKWTAKYMIGDKL